MAIFNNGNIANKSDKTDTNTTIITAGSTIKGEVELSCNLYIDGDLEGSIHSSKEINVGKNGHVKGDVSAERLVVQGFVDGSIHAKRIEIKATGHIKGEITYAELVIEAKGIFEGNSMIQANTSKPLQSETGK